MSLSETQVRRYSRHILLPDIGGRGQRRLLDGAVRVMVGSERIAELVALAYLAAAGVGTLVLAGDTETPPTADELRWGLLLGAADGQRSRHAAISERVAALNPDVRVTTEPVADCLELSPMEAPAVDASRLASALITGGLAASHVLAQLIRGNA